MQILDQYYDIRNQIFSYFGYEENWRILPFDDSRNCFWRLNENGRGGGTVDFAETESELDGDFYQNTIYTQRYLKQWIYRGEQYTMILVDTNTDCNQFLQIFTNANQRI